MFRSSLKMHVEFSIQNNTFHVTATFKRQNVRKGEPFRALFEAASLPYLFDIIFNGHEDLQTQNPCVSKGSIIIHNNHLGIHSKHTLMNLSISIQNY